MRRIARAWRIHVVESPLQREPAPAPGLPCPSCREDLSVSTCQDSFLLICRCGRQVSMEDLLKVPSSGLAPGLEALSRTWEDRLLSLRSLSSDARSKGFPNISEVMDRHVRNLEARLERLMRVAQAYTDASSHENHPRGARARE